MNSCVYQKCIEESTFEECRFTGLFNTLHIIVRIGIHQSKLVHEVTVVQDGDGIREPIANSYTCSLIGFMIYLHS
jgi:hypothetical protein